MKRSILFALMVMPAMLSMAQVPDPQPNTYVNDLAGKLTQTEVTSINESLLKLEKATSVQMAILLIDKLPDNMTIEDYTLEVGRKWHVGNAQNGLVYVAAFGSKKQRLEVAVALQSLVTDVEASHITDELKVIFRQQNYYGGLQHLIQSVSEKIAPGEAQQRALGDAELAKKKDNSNEAWMYILSFLVISGITGGWLYSRKRQREAEEKLKAESLRLRTLSGIRSALSKNKESREHAARRPASDYIPPPVSDVPVTAPYIPTRSEEPPSSSSYGDWGSGSSDSSSSYSSGFDGGGSSGDL